jgi:hypothetical protein
VPAHYVYEKFTRAHTRLIRYDRQMLVQLYTMVRYQLRL